MMLLLLRIPRAIGFQLINTDRHVPISIPGFSFVCAPLTENTGSLRNGNPATTQDRFTVSPITVFPPKN